MTSTSGDRGDNWGISRGGEIIHEVGATRMGDNPKTSVLNSVLPGVGLQEPVRHRRRAVRQQRGQEPHALTITALGWRTSEYIADQMKKRNL